MSFWPRLIDLVREVRWVWPGSVTHCTGLSLSFVILLILLACLFGCCCGALTTLLAISSTLRRLDQQLILSFLALSTPVATSTPPAHTLRKRLGEYRGSA